MNDVRCNRRKSFDTGSVITNEFQFRIVHRFNMIFYSLNGLNAMSLLIDF